MVKKGDTLIEVTIAIGIFSMVAIGIVAVMSGGSAGAETALETTLAREEIDTQAEALRFIQASASIDKNSANGRIHDLWQKITSNAVDLSTKTEDAQAAILQYSPSSCKEAYTFDGYTPFIINPRALGDYANGSVGIGSVYLPYRPESGSSNQYLTETTTYPRLVFGSSGDSLLNNSTNFHRAEGIYIIAVEDPKTTQVINNTASNSNGHAVAYYDFYIRTCWYGINASKASTISTVIRLHNPDVVDETVTPDASLNPTTSNLTIHSVGGTFWNASGVAQSSPLTISCGGSGGCNFPAVAPTRSGYTFKGYSTSAAATTGTYQPGEHFNPLLNLNRTFYAVWQENNETINITLSWTASADYDAKITGQKFDGTSFAVSRSTTSTSTNFNGRSITVAKIDKDCRGANCSETITINTLGGKNFYYSVFNYSSIIYGSDVKVTISSSSLGSHTFRVSDATGTGRNWNVFAIKNGKLFVRQTLTDTAETIY